MRWLWRGIWNLSEFTGISLGKAAPIIFGLMIGRKGEKMTSGTMYKKCSRCGEELLRSKFYRDTRYADGLSSRCKSCIKVAVVHRRRQSGVEERRSVVNENGNIFCIKCKSWKPFSEMSADRNKRFGVKTHCKECENKRKRNGD